MTFQCRYRHPFTRRETVQAAYKLGSAFLADRSSNIDVAQCFLQEHHEGPHLVINPWDNTVHGYYERSK